MIESIVGGAMGGAVALIGLFALVWLGDKWQSRKLYRAIGGRRKH